MNRREAIKQLAFLTGGALSMTTVSAIMGGCTSESGSAALKTLTPTQNEMVVIMTELILPATDTPGAKAAKVNQFIDKMLTDWHTKEEREHFLTGLDHTNEVSKNMHNNNFADLNESAQIEVLKELEKESQKVPEAVSNNNLKPFFNMLKELTVVGYYTSEVGASQELQANIIPGYYEACMPYSEVGSAWSGAGS